MSKINVSQWKEFKLTELFTVSSGTKFDRRRVILTPEPHNINFIGRTGSLNGINAKCGTYKNTEPFSAGLLTVALGGTIGACFVQNKPFYTSQNVDVLIPLKCYVSKMTWNVKQFIASCIFYESQNNYLTFVRELNKHIKRDFVIKLPVTSSGQPDWQYMDEYIAKLATQAHTNISLLRQQQKKAPTVNIDRWKEFKLSELFDVDLSDGDNKPKQLESGDIPLVVASGDNNGIIGKFTSDTRVYPEGTITLDMFGHAFLQNHKFQAVSHGRVNMLLPKMDVSLNSLLFIVGVLNKKCSEGAYGYAKMLSQSEANAIVIKLPVISSGQPNWHYMDEYIAKLATQAHTNIGLLRQ